MNNPLQNSPFENHTIFAWFLEQSRKWVKDIEVENVTIIGSNPFNHTKLKEILTSNYHQIDFWNSDDFLDFCHVLVVGRENVNLEILDQHIKFRQGRNCKIYSQEMIAAYILTGSDPFNASNDLLLAFAKGHPVLEFLLDEYDPGFFYWPHMKVGIGLSSIEVELSQEGMLGALGYHAGKSGLSNKERHVKLSNIFRLETNQLPEIENRESMKKWLDSSPKTCERLRLIVQTIFLHWKNKKNNKTQWKAVQDYEDDLQWLKKKYYEKCNYKFNWPDTRVYSQSN